MANHNHYFNFSIYNKTTTTETANEKLIKPLKDFFISVSPYKVS